MPERSLLSVLTLMAFYLLTSSIVAVNYEQGDWVEYTNFRHITSVAADQNVVYFGTTGGIIRYDRFSRRWLHPLTASGGLVSNYIKQLAYEPTYNELWAQTDKGTAKYNITFEKWYPEFEFPSHLVKNVWNHSRFTSLFTPVGYDYSDGYILDKEMRQHPVTVAFEDIDDLMYVGTWGMGIAIINTRHLQLEPVSYGPYNYNISKIISIDNRLWLGNDYSLSDRGITRFDLNSEEWLYYEPQFTRGLASAKITSGIKSLNVTLLGTSEGLVKIENETSVYTISGLPSQYILSLAEYDGFVFVGTDNGMGIIPAGGVPPDSSFNSPIPGKFLLRGFRVNDLLVHNDILYIATNDGIYTFGFKSRVFMGLDTPSSELAYGVNDIFTDGRSIYFAARFGVVIIDTKTNNIDVATDPALSDDWQIFEVYSDKKYIWAATSRGLWRYNKSDRSTWLYTVADGLPANYINSLAADGDYLWLGSRQGLIRFLWNSPNRGD